MWLLIAVIGLSSGLSGGAAPPVQTPPATLTRPSAWAGVDRARAWLALVDRNAWEGSRRAASPSFRSQITASQ